MNIIESIKNKVITSVEKAIAYRIVVVYLDGKTQHMGEYKTLPEAIDNSKHIVNSYAKYSLMIYILSNNGRKVMVFENHKELNRLKKQQEQKMKEDIQRAKLEKIKEPKEHDSFGFGLLQGSPSSTRYTSLGLAGIDPNPKKSKKRGFL